MSWHCPLNLCNILAGAVVPELPSLLRDAEQPQMLVQNGDAKAETHGGCGVQ